MAAASTYRFLPWARRGLADRVPAVDAGAALPARATVGIGLTLRAMPEHRFDLSLYGPGDIVGVDPRLVIRTDPRPGSADVEPNYFPLIEFDPPDLPWLFTPASSGANDRLRPWCVLVVVDLSVVDAPRVEPGRPLPLIVVPAAVADRELPDLSESWAWAHAQAITQAGTVDLPAELAANPSMNVSRIVAPRRLEPGKRYAACLVPAFDAGVLRGLGGAPAPDAVLGPAWPTPATGDVRLPVYFHWEFTTGPAGDFESLARHLKPFAAPDSVGVERMYVGGAGPELPATPPDDPAGYLEMDGALRAPRRSSGTLGDVPVALQATLQTALDAAAEQAQAGSTPTTPVLGPPIYGAWHARQQTIPADLPAWLRELNLDPRARAAAGLGAELERGNQEEFMQWCWEQVGRILEANRLLGRARLSLEALARVHSKHLATLPADRLLQIAAPLHDRTREGAATVAAAIARSSLPDASADPALRRLTSAQRPARRAAERLAAAAGRVAAPVRLVAGLASGTLEVDPTGFVPHGLAGVPALAALPVPATGDATVDLTPTGLPVSVDASLVRQLRTDSAAVAADPAPHLVARDDLSAGLLDEEHLVRVRELVDAARTPGQTLVGTLGAVTRATASMSGEAALLVTAQPEQPVRVDALDVDAGGHVVVRGPGGLPGTVVATLDPASVGRAGAVLSTLPPAALDPSGAAPPRIAGATAIMRPRAAPVAGRLPLDGGVLAGGGSTGGVFTGGAGTTGPVLGEPSITLPPPVRDAPTIARFQTALLTVAPAGQVGPAAPQRSFVAFAVASARDTLVTRTDPRRTVPARLGTILVAGGTRVLDGSVAGLDVVPTLDRIMAAPGIDVAVYDYLARYDPSRFLPGVGEIPADAITLLETNPRFVEAVLVGLNQEMNRELLWRAFPTDQRGTPFRRFWAWSDGGADIQPIHLWPAAGALGANGRGGPGGQIALLVRGRLLRRYPNTSLYAWRSRNGALRNPPATADIRRPVFAGVLGEDIAFAGFDLTDADLREGDGWFFVLQQQPTEPRFGFDEMIGGGAPPALTSWSDATWAHTGTAPGGYLHIAGSPLAGQQLGAARFVDHAAHLAVITQQKPMRVAIHGRSMVQPGG